MTRGGAELEAIAAFRLMLIRREPEDHGSVEPSAPGEPPLSSHLLLLSESRNGQPNSAGLSILRAKAAPIVVSIPQWPPFS
jgi:hypothetical protein